MTQAFAAAAFSELGRRERNEDAYADVRSDDGRIRAFAVADGLGGHDRGEVASAAAVAAVRGVVARAREDGDLDALIAGAFADANAAVAAAKLAASGSEMATTLALVVSDGSSVAWGHCGDTRIYRLRGGELERLTRDHTVAGSLAALGTRGARTEHSNHLLAALDGRALVFEAAPAQALLAGDAFVLCSDGVWGAVADREMLEAARAASDLDGWLERLRGALLRRDDPGQDNATALGFASGDGGFAIEPRKERTLLRRIFRR